jgi:Tol biopolymer transport system component
MRASLRLLSLFPFLVILAFLYADAPALGNGYTIYFQSDRGGDSIIYRLDGDEAVPATQSGAEHPSVTADGSMLFYTRITETNWGRFWNVYYIQDDEEHRLSTNEIYDELEPAVSRDGTFAAFTSMRSGNLEIITVPMDDRENQFQITQTEKPDEEPALSRDGEWVCWTGRTGNTSSIFRAPGRGGDAERVTEGVVWEEHASVSVDNRYIVYSATVEDNSDIYILDTESDERTRLTDDPAWDGHPNISADGQKIVFTSDRDGNNEIYMMNRDGTDLVRLTDNEAIDDFACIT